MNDWYLANDSPPNSPRSSSLSGPPSSLGLPSSPLSPWKFTSSGPPSSSGPTSSHRSLLSLDADLLRAILEACFVVFELLGPIACCCWQLAELVAEGDWSQRFKELPFAASPRVFIGGKPAWVPWPQELGSTELRIRQGQLVLSAWRRVTSDRFPESLEFTDKSGKHRGLVLSIDRATTRLVSDDRWMDGYLLDLFFATQVLIYATYSSPTPDPPQRPPQPAPTAVATPIAASPTAVVCPPELEPEPKPKPSPNPNPNPNPAQRAVVITDRPSPSTGPNTDPNHKPNPNPTLTLDLTLTLTLTLTLSLIWP